MRYRHAVLMLLMFLATLPVMYLSAAPAPEPAYAILDIGPPPKELTAEEYRNRYIKYLFTLCGYDARHDPEVKKLTSVVNSQTPWLWLEKNLRVMPEKEGRRLRLTFRAGSRAEQAAILNSVLRIYIQKQMDHRKVIEKKLQQVEEALPRLKKLAATEANAIQRARCQQELESAPSYIAEFQAEIARHKEISVIKWAK